MKSATAWLWGLAAVGLLAAVAVRRMPWPVPFAGVTSPFGERDGTFHNGIDLRAPIGTPVAAPLAGEVLETGYDERGGFYLVALLSNAVRAGFAHLRDLPTVAAGDAFAAGDVLAYTGDTGNARGPHLHYTLKRGDTWLDPANYSA